MDKDNKNNEGKSSSSGDRDLFLKIKEVQGLPDEVVSKFLTTKGILAGDKNERN